jgi:hypothetical protein
MFRLFPVFTVLPKLSKQISLIFLHLVLKMFQPNHGLCFILVSLLQTYVELRLSSATAAGGARLAASSATGLRTNRKKSSLCILHGFRQSV